MKRICSVIAILAMQFVGLVVWAAPSNAESTWYNLSDHTYRCGLWGARPNWETFFQVSGRVGNDGIQNRGYITDGAGLRYSQSKSCTYWDPKSLSDAYGKFVVSANGWGIDSFSASWPPSVEVSGWDKSLEKQLQFGAGAQGSWYTAYDYYFDAGGFGDVSSMRIDGFLTVERDNATNSQRELHLSDVSGNIA